MTKKRFNVRVYGIVINDRGELLVMDELIRGIEFTKFPGGGLEWGEGTRECLEREFQEELNQQVEVGEHYYTTDYFLASAFNPDDQLLSLYYRVELKGGQSFEAKTTPFDFPDEIGNQYEVPRWVPIKDLSADDFKWPVDKTVVQMIVGDQMIR